MDVEITFEDLDGKTIMTMVQKEFPSAKMRDLHRVGLSHAFDQIGHVVRTQFA